MEEVQTLISTYGLETVVIALLVNILTGFAKIPVKKAAKKLNDYTVITRFIVFLPIVFGFVLSYCYSTFVCGVFNFDAAFIRLWITSSSLSLTIYAIFEKTFPSTQRKTSKSEVKADEQLSEEVAELLEAILPQNDEAEQAATERKTAEKNFETNKIILRGKTNVESDVKE
ncbi:MAG: hypothetical protein ACI4S9_04300 [Christensenellales bacterium]